MWRQQTPTILAIRAAHVVATRRPGPSRSCSDERFKTRQKRGERAQHHTFSLEGPNSTNGAGGRRW